jgi:WD40-like Beta Propeller Repeat
MPRAAAPQMLTILLWLALDAIAGVSAQQPEATATRYLQREEMVDAIIHNALLGDCRTRRAIFGSAFVSTCKAREIGDGEPIRMMIFLDRLPDDALIEICRRNQIADCEKPKEVSSGRPILTLESVFDIEFNSPKATWSPDGRLLLLDNLNLPGVEARLLDVAAGKLLSPPLYAGSPISDAAWSPDGKWLALSERSRVYAERDPALATVRLYASALRRETARISAGDAGCSAGLAEGMAFTADSKALWILCSHETKEAKAIKLKVPALTAQDSFVPQASMPGWSESYWEEGLLRSAGDLIMSIRFATPKPVNGPRSAVQAFRLSNREPLYPPMHVGRSRLADDLSGLYVGTELWSTQSAQRLATDVKPSGRYLAAPNRLPGMALHIEARAPHKSLHGGLAVIDSATGVTAQEIGPIPKVVTVLVSPDGTRVAVAGFRGIRFYRVSR